MAAPVTTTVRMFGALHDFRRGLGLEPVAELEIPPEGRSALEVARELDLPLDKIEAVFINHRAQGLEETIRPGDRVAFIPTGVPGPHRFLLNIYGSGKKGEE